MDSSSQAFYVFVGILILTLMGSSVVVFIVHYQRKQFKSKLKQQAELQSLVSDFQDRMLANSLEVQESVRQNISKDLHDEIGGLLSATKMSIAVISKNLSDDEENKERIANAKGLVEEALAQVRSLARDLVPRTLENFGLVAAIEEFAQKMQLATNIDFLLEMEGLDNEIGLSPNLKLGVYRVIQELSNNAIKHAQASQISIVLHRLNDKLLINFEDNGVGFDLDLALQNPASGLGLRNIQSRLSVLKAEYSMSSIPNNGTKTTIEIKLN